MSREAWGDESNVPERWEDTAMRQEWNEARHKLRLWIQRFKDEFPNDEFDAAVSTISDAMDELELQMEGPL